MKTWRRQIDVRTAAVDNDKIDQIIKNIRANPVH